MAAIIMKLKRVGEKVCPHTQKQNIGSRVWSGPEYAMDLIFNRYANVHVDGIDISGTMKEEASHRLASEAGSGEVFLWVGDIAETELRPQYYDAVFTVNNYTLWENRYEGLWNLYSAMTSCEKIAITVSHGKKMQKRIKQPYLPKTSKVTWRHSRIYKNYDKV